MAHARKKILHKQKRMKFYIIRFRACTRVIFFRKGFWQHYKNFGFTDIYLHIYKKTIVYDKGVMQIFLSHGFTLDVYD